MKRIDKLPRYHQIYEQLYENPYIYQTNIAKNTPFSRSTVSTYLAEMYDNLILQGPFIFVKPAKNYHEYVYYLEVNNQLSVYKSLSENPHVIEVTACSGDWNISMVTDCLFDVSTVEGFRKIVYQGIKGVTHLSKVTSVDWDHSMEKVQNIISTPENQSTLYEEIAINPWSEKEWCLYRYFKSNVRKKVMPILREHKIQFQHYQKWVSQLPEIAVIQPAFYPHTFPTYFVFDFLFESAYHQHLTTVLGLLPPTSVFFSAGDHVTARLFAQNSKEVNDLFTLILELKEPCYFTESQYSIPLPVSEW